MKKLLIVTLIAILLLISLCACSSDVVKDEPITIFVGLGNNKTYYTSLASLINEKLKDVKIKFVYQNTYDTTTSVRLEFKNNDLPADIMITASKTPDNLLENTCIDLLKSSHITKYFSYGKISECTASDGGVYQLPFTSKLIGITYNKTLLEEKGWSVPKTFDDMVALKKKCDDDHIKFAVTDGNLTGHGFNWFFHLLGADYITSIDGTSWFEDFIAGKKDTTEFAPHAEYFKKWYEAGLFGEFHTTESGLDSFSQSRALFYFNLTNSNYSYSGQMIDGDGDVIEGVTLNDRYASIPWISEDGLSNYYTSYDNMFLSLNKNLSNDTKRLNKCLEILELMTTNDAVKMYTSLYDDGYIAVNNFKPSETCMFKDYIDDINAGQTQPWYYNYFDNDTIVNTGEIINRYLNGEAVTLNDILVELQRNVTNYATGTTQNRGIVFDETLSYKDVAKINAITAGKTVQTLLDNAKINEEVTVALIPYVEKLEDYAPFNNKLGLVNTKLYKGQFNDVYIKTVIPANSSRPVAIKLKGSEILDIVEDGLDLSKDLGYDDDYGPYPIAIVTKGGFKINKDTTYTVAANITLFTNDQYKDLVKDNKILISNEKNINYALFEETMLTYLANLKHVSSKNIVW